MTELERSGSTRASAICSPLTLRINPWKYSLKFYPVETERHLRVIHLISNYYFHQDNNNLMYKSEVDNLM